MIFKHAHDHRTLRSHWGKGLKLGMINGMIFAGRNSEGNPTLGQHFPSSRSHCEEWNGAFWKKNMIVCLGFWRGGTSRLQVSPVVIVISCIGYARNINSKSSNKNNNGDVLFGGMQPGNACANRWDAFVAMSVPSVLRNSWPISVHPLFRAMLDGRRKSHQKH